MKKHANDEDDAPPGGRALDRLRQFEMERGYDEPGAVPSSQQEDEGQDEATGESQPSEKGGGGAASDSSLPNC